MIRSDLLGSIDRNEPSDPTPSASGAPKFDRLPTRIRFGSSTAPFAMKVGNLLGMGVRLPQKGPGRNVPTCAMADAPGISTAMTPALRGIGSARAACHAASPSATTIPAAKAIMPGKLIMNFRMFVGHAAQYIFNILIANLP